MKLLKTMVVALAAGLSLLAAAGSAEARWLRAESPHFIVYSDGDETVLRGQVERLEVFHDLLVLQMRPPPQTGPARKLPIYLVGDRRKLKRVSPSLTDSIAGVYYASPSDVFAVADRTRGEDHTLQHEYVHHFMLQYFPSSYPAWLVEGIAEYWMATEVKPGYVHYGKEVVMRSSWLDAGVSLPLRDVLSKRVSEITTGEGQAVYYAKAWILTHYLMQAPARQAQLNQYVNLVAAGGDPVASMEKATGQSVAALEKALTAYIKGSYTSTRHQRTAYKVKPVITAMPDSADDLLLEAQQLKLARGDAKTGAPLLAAVRKAAARHPGDRFAELTLARAETHLGDRAAGEAILKRLLAAEPNDVEALLVMASSRMAEGDRKDDAGKRAAYREARRHLETAFKADSGRYDTLYAYVNSRSVEPGFPNANDLEVLTDAYFGAPQVSNIRMHLGQVLLSRNRHADAVLVLQPLANNPHGGSMVAAARKMIAEAREASAPGAKAGQPGAAASPGGS